MSKYLTKKELHRAIKATSSLDDKEEAEVSMLFAGSFDEDHYDDRHLSAEEIEKGLAYLRAHIGKHRLSSSEIDDLEKHLRKFL